MTDAAELSVSTPISKYGFCLRPSVRKMRLVYESASDTDVDMSAVVLKRLPAHFGLGLLFRKKYWICFFKVDCMSFFGQDAKKMEIFVFRCVRKSKD